MALTIEQYIAQFGELDEYGEYAARLKEELADHFDDSVYTAMVFGAPEIDATQKALQNMGEPRRIIHEFKTIMKFNNKWAVWLESVFLGVVSIPFFHFIFLMFGTGISNDSIFGIGWKGILISGGLFILSFSALAIFYYCTTGKLLRFVQDKKSAFLLSIPLFLPPIVFALLYVDSIAVPQVRFFLYFSAALLPGMMDFFFLVQSAFKKKREMVLNPAKHQKKTSGKAEKFFQWLSVVFSIVYIPFILVTNDRNLLLDPTHVSSFGYFFAKVRSFFEGMNLPILDFQINGMFGGYEGFYVLAFLYIFLAVVSFYHIVHFLVEKNALRRLVDFPWFRLTLLVYVFSLFFLVTAPRNSELEWRVPVRNISAEIKHDQLGFTYKMISYLDHRYLGRQKPFFLYQIIPGGNYFTIRVPDNEGLPHDYYLNTKNNEALVLNKTDSVSDFEIARVADSKEIKPFFHGATELPSEVECIEDKDKPIAYTLESGPHEDEGSVDISSHKYCHKLLYNGKLVYTQTKANRLYQFELMPENPRFALIKLETGEFGPQEVYLVDLASFK